MGALALRVQLHGMPEMVTGLAFTCDARALVAAGSDAALRMWDLTSGRVRHTLTGHVAKVLPPRVWGFRPVTSSCLHRFCEA